VVTDSDGINDQELRRQLHQRLPAALIPHRIVRLESIPRTGSGKVDRHRLASTDLDVPRLVTETNDNLTDHERILVRLCRHLLRLDQVSPQDNFFHIGGDSLLSIRLISMAREAGLEIEPKDILECNSITELAAAAEHRSRGEASPQQAHAGSVISNVRAGKQAGSLLLVHEVGGQCHYAHYLAADLAPQRTLYVTQQPAPGDSPSSIEALAKLYVDAWVRAEPDGPRWVLAFCWGGLLGYEIARQLKQLGQSIDAVMIVESGTEAAYVHAPQWNRHVDQMKGNLVRVRNRVRSLNSREAFGNLLQTLYAKLMRRRNDPITADAGFQFRDDEGDPEQIRTNVQAFLDYAIQPDELPLHLFRVAGPSGLIGTRYSDRSLGWRYLVGKHLTLHSIPGTHNTCMQPPHVGKLADAINRVIDG
jgi:thioesterase domain-containing protein